MPHYVGVISALSVLLAAPLQPALASPAAPQGTELLLQGQKQWNQKDLIAALDSFDQVLALDAQNAEALVGRWRVLSTLGLQDQALEEAHSTSAVAAATLQTLHEDKAAQAIRWSEQVYYSKPHERYPVSDAAIAMVQANLLRYPDSLRSRFDWIRALSNRQRYAEAIQAYEALDNTGIDLPAYVHAFAGRAYFAEKKPEAAARVYRLALAAEPDDFDVNLGLFFALSDQAQFGTANQHIQNVAAATRLPEAKFTANTTAITGLAYAGQLAEAQDQFLQLQQEAPNSTSLHIALGRIYLWRGWPERAKAELELAALGEPDDIRSQNALVEVDTVRGDYLLAQQRLNNLQVIASDDPDVKNLVRAQTVRQYNEVSLFVSGTRSKDSAGNSHGIVFDAKYKAPPIGLQTRPYVRAYTESDTTDNVRTEYQRLGLGLEHRFAAAGSLEAEIQQEVNLEKKSSLMLGGTWNMNDYWSINGRWDSNSTAVPLRARADAISGWKTEVGAGYRAHEGASARADYAELHMSDQNLRRSVALAGNYTVLQRPLSKGIVGLEWAASANSLGNAAYFNPQSDSTAQVSYTTEWLTYMAQSRTLRQQLVLAVGRYAQEGYAAGAIGSIRYEHDWRLSDVAQLRYGLGYVHRVYDGLVTDGPEANLSFNWRF